MPVDYGVCMWLTYSPRNRVAFTAFLDRFPQATGEDWFNFDKQGEGESDLAYQLNGKVFDDCESDIKSDTGLANATHVLAFATGTWQDGGGGQHETKVPINVTASDGTDDVDWTFDHDQVTYNIQIESRHVVK